MSLAPSGNVAFFHAYPHQYAGAQRVTQMLCEALRERGCDAIVLLPDHGPFSDALSKANIRVCIVPAPSIWRRYGRALEGPLMVPALARLPAYWLRVARALQRLTPQPEVVHVNDHRGMLMAGVASKVAGLPLVWHLHDAYGPRVLTAAGAGMADGIIAVSRDTFDQLPSLHPHSRKVQIVHNGLPRRETQSPPRRAPERPTVICGARIHPNKGIDTLVHATASVREQIPNVRVLVAGHVQQGSESYMERLTRLVGERDLESNVEFTGFVEDPHGLWRTASVYVQPSRVEPFGLGVLEAMAEATPVIATRIGGLREIIIEGESGLLVEPDDPLALADALVRVLTDRELAGRLGNAGWHRAVTDFSTDRMVDGVTEVYARSKANACR